MSDIESYFPSCFACSFIGRGQYLAFHTNVNKCPVPDTAPSNHGSRQRKRDSLTAYGRLSALKLGKTQSFQCKFRSKRSIYFKR